METATKPLTAPTSKPIWPTFLDGVFDGLVVAFAGWTVFYQFALAFQFSMLWAGWPWILLTGVLSIAWGLRRGRHDAPRPEAPDASGTPRTRPAPSRAVAIGAGILVVLAILVANREEWGVWPIAVTVIALVALQLLQGARTAHRSPTKPADATLDVPGGAHVLALALSAAFGVLGMFLLRPDADDAFYVNRATWVAQYGTAATNDTMFGPNVMPPSYSGGLLTPSIEALQGVVAHSLGVQAATLCYVLAVPLLGTMAGWTTWRLIRAWAPRRPALVMVAAMVFLVASGDSIVGGYSLGRIWQGKATAYMILIPLAWLLLSQTVVRARRSDLVMLVAAGVAFVGLTTTSALLAPVVAGAALLAAIILRSKSLALGAAAFLLGPIINGLAQAFGPAAIGGGGDNAIAVPQMAFTLALGSSVAMIVLALIALIAVPRTIVGPKSVLMACGVIATMVSLLPGIFVAADAVTGAGAVAWRLTISLPVWVLVGLLAAWPDVSAQTSGRSRNVASAALAAVAAAVIIVPLAFGTMLWKAPGASLTSRPTWKVSQAALADVRAVQARDLPGGVWLLPPEQMQILSITTVGPYAVVPRAYYLSGVDAESGHRADRIVLFNLAAGNKAKSSRVRDAIERLDVSVACVPASAKRSSRTLKRALDTELERIGDLKCAVR